MTYKELEEKLKSIPVYSRHPKDKENWIKRYKLILEFAKQEEKSDLFRTFDVKILPVTFQPGIVNEGFIDDGARISTLSEFEELLNRHCIDNFYCAATEDYVCISVHYHDSDLRVGHYYICQIVDLNVCKEQAEKNYRIYNPVYIAIRMAQSLAGKNHSSGEYMGVRCRPLIDFSEKKLLIDCYQDPVDKKEHHGCTSLFRAATADEILKDFIRTKNNKKHS